MAESSSANGIKESDPQAGTYLAIWFFFQITADHVCLPVLVATFSFAKGVKRTPTLVNMCITWIIAGISSSLLLYAGKQSGPEPSHALCILQASLLDGTPPMCSLSALALIYTVWTSLSCTSDVCDSRGAKYGIYTMLITPYVAFFGFALATSVVALQDLRKVDRARRFFYCSVENNPLSNTMGIFSATICLICIFFEVLIAIRIFRIWRAFKSIKSGYQGRSFDKQLILRLFIFSGYLLVALVFSVTSIPNLKSAVPDIFAASIGMAVFLVFGTQSDILRAWAFWLPSRPPPVPPKDINAGWNSQAHPILPVAKPFSNGHAASIISDTETLHDPNDIHHLHHLHSSTPSPSGHAMPATRASLMSRKGDSVIIINTPEEAFGALGERESASV